MVYDGSNSGTLWSRSSHMTIHSLLRFELIHVCFIGLNSTRLFGGKGFQGASGRTNTLFRYSLLTSQWTWMGGCSTGLSATSTHSYGTRGVATLNNWPPAREEFTMVIDNTYTTIWLFGNLHIPYCATNLFHLKMFT
jgi:hypothetical protein